MAALRDLGCGNCGGDLPDKPERRRVPRRGGRKLPVCAKCAKEIDRQGTLDTGRAA